MPVCRAYHASDREACVALLRAGHDPRFDEARFRWLHEQAPGGPSRIVVCERDKAVVGMSAVIPRPALLDGRPVLAGRDVDPVVDPSCRGQGVFGLMLSWLLEHLDGVQILYNFANPASAPGFLRRGWRPAGRLSDRVVQLGHDGLFGREHLLHLATWPRARRRNGDEIREVAGDDLAALPAPAGPGEGFGVVRSGAHLAWRYGASPLRSYRIFARRRAGVLQDVVVLRHDAERRRLIVMDVAEYVAGAGDLGCYLARWREEFGGCWTCVWSATPAAWRRGFLGNPRSRGQQLLVRAAPGSEALVAALEVDRMLVTHGDVEAN